MTWVYGLDLGSVLNSDQHFSPYHRHGNKSQTVNTIVGPAKNLLIKTISDFKCRHSSGGMLVSSYGF